MASRIPSLVVFLSPFWRRRVHWSSSVNFNGELIPSKCPWPFFTHAQLLIPIQDLWSGPANSLCQLFIIILANIFLVTRLVHGPLIQADSIPIPNLQYSWPHKESRPESHTFVLFNRCLCVRYGRNDLRLDGEVRSCFMPNTDPRLTLSKVSSRLNMLHPLSGTHHKQWRSALYHVSHIFLPVIRRHDSPL